MTVSTIATIASGLSRTLGNQTTKPSTVLNSLFTGAASSGRSDGADVTAAISLQNQIAQFRVASQNVAQAGSLLSAADSGAGQVTRELGKLKDLASRAATFPLSNSERAQINAEFQAIRSRINSVAQDTKFGGETLLNGTSTQLKIQSEDGSQPDQMVANLTDAALFGGKAIDLLSPKNAQVAVDAVISAQSYTQTQINTLKALQDGLDYAVGTLQAAMQNHDAANSTLDGLDMINQLLGGVNSSAATGLDTKALFAQTNKLPASILQLLGA